MHANIKSHFVGISLLITASVSWMAFHQAGEHNGPREVIVPFESGADINPSTQENINVIVAAMIENPDFKALVKGHTNTWGSSGANLALSQSRADTIAEKLRESGIETERITAIGVGSQEPSLKGDDEGRLSYQRSLSRVTVSLQIR